jgi:hypothetical protein
LCVCVFVCLCVCLCVSGYTFLRTETTLRFFIVYVKSKY